MAGTPADRQIAAERDAIESEIAGGTLLTAFAKTTARYGDVEAFRWEQAGQWRSLTYGELRQRVRDATVGLLALGLQPGEPVVLWSRNRPEPNIAGLAVLHARGVPVFLYDTIAQEQAAYITDHCEAAVAIVEDRGFLARLAAMRSRLTQLRQVVLIDGPVGAREDWLISWDDLLTAGRATAQCSPELFYRTWHQADPEDLATLLYTSGTFGRPKGAMITHRKVRYLAAAIFRVIPPQEFAPEAGSRVVSYLPMAHATGRWLDHWLPMIRPFTVVFCPDPAQVFQVAAQVRPTVQVGAPRVWENLHATLLAKIAAEPEALRQTLQRAVEAGRQRVRRRQRGLPYPDAAAETAPADPDEHSARALRSLLAAVGLDACLFAASGSAPIDPDVLEFFHALGLPMTEALGMTEATGCAALSRPSRARNGSVGVACPGMELRLAADGELLVRGPLVVRGYYRDLIGTAEAIDPDGWLHTGDIAVLNPDGYLWITGRKKEMITTSGGENISPAAVESFLRRHPLVAQACVVGDRRDYLAALLVLDGAAAGAWAQRRGITALGPAGLAADPQVLAEVERGVRAANERLGRAEKVRRFAVLPDAWTVETGELTPSLKLRRRVVADRHAGVIERLYGPADSGVIDVEPPD